MQTYARIADGVVAELLATDAEPRALFHPDLIWIEAPPPVAVGWRRTPDGFAPPAPPPEAPAPSLEELQAQLAALAARLAALSGG